MMSHTSPPVDTAAARQSAVQGAPARRGAAPSSLAAWATWATWAIWATWTVGGAAGLAVVAQISIPLWFTPVPLSLATLGVWTLALAGGWRGVGAVGLYAVAGALGAPVLAGGASGVGATFGYVVGYVVAAALVAAVGALGARRRRERTAAMAGPQGSAAQPRWRTTVLHGVGPGAVGIGVGTVAVYACGATWLAAATGMDARAALAAGVLPFLVGDAIKLLAGGVVASAIAR